jgi:hypothetical protein|tara:strand:- start:4145 stop:4468 length:324 start_codon:yes stop_codon:yes gene_type:complete
MKNEIQTYCTNCSTERKNELVGETNTKEQIYWCNTCGLIRIPRMKKPLEEKADEPCPHNFYCMKRQELQFPLCRNDYANECGQVKRFYDKYGDMKDDSEFFGRARCR